MKTKQVAKEVDKIEFEIALLQCKRPSKQTEEELDKRYKRLEKIKAKVIDSIEGDLFKITGR